MEARELSGKKGNGPVLGELKIETDERKVFHNGNQSGLRKQKTTGKGRRGTNQGDR